MAGRQTLELHSDGGEPKEGPEGPPKFTNTLIDQTSPYLLQHAHNPVNWHSWGNKAFDLARKTGKPIFLSIGYSTCYWCHVMERLVFENTTIAAQMNAHFVSIKVDREERPDVDDVYMAAAHVMSERGGWPLSVFLTPPGTKGADDPGLKPFFVGTYFPPEPAHGQRSFPQILESMTNAWETRREEVIRVADSVADAVKQSLGRRDAGGTLGANMVQDAVKQLFRSYDPVHGGFGRAPKFPTPNNLLLLMHVHEGNANPELWQAVTHTFERMARGGMYDQVGGGFHRYSTDEKWLVPHFEKMLYDNGQLVEAYLIAQSIEPNQDDPDLYPRIVRQTCDYVLREMTDPTGTFWSAQDAEVDAHEGGNYLWDPQQIRAAIHDDKLADLAITLYGLDTGTNFRDPHLPGADPRNVLFVPKRFGELAKEHNMSLTELAAAKADIDQQLLKVRDRRKQPSTDDKVLVSWNGLMIAGMARAGRDLGESRYARAAAKAATYILQNMRTSDGGLYRTMRKGKAKIPAFLEDYAFFVHGLIELYRTDHDRKWLEGAQKLMQLAKQKFGDPEMGGYYDTLADQADLFVRTRSTFDGAIPTGNSQMVHNLLDLYQVTKEPAYAEEAARSLQAFAGAMQGMGHGMAHMQHGLLRAHELAPKALVAQRQPAPAEPLVPKPLIPGAEAPLDGRLSPAEPVAVKVHPQELDLSSGSATLRVIIDIGREFHINSSKPGDDNVEPTTLRLEDAAGLELQVKYPPGTKKEFSYGRLTIYEGKTVIEAIVRSNGKLAPDAKPRFILHYQVCTDTYCLEGKDMELPVRVKF